MDDEVILTFLFFALCYGLIVHFRKKAPPVKTVTLRAGRYTAGNEIAPGKYNLTATVGTGDLCFHQKDAPEWGYSNPISVGSEDHSNQFHNVELGKGDVLELNGSVVVNLTPATAITDVKTQTLHPGVYHFSVDVPAGKYSLEAVGGCGHVFLTEEGKEEVIFFQHMALSHAQKAGTFSNLTCTKKHTLWVMESLQLRLVPVPKNNPM